MDKTRVWTKRSATYATFYCVRKVYLPTDAEQSNFLTQLLALRSTDVTYIQLFKKTEQGTARIKCDTVQPNKKSVGSLKSSPIYETA